MNHLTAAILEIAEMLETVGRTNTPPTPGACIRLARHIREACAGGAGDPTVLAEPPLVLRDDAGVARGCW
jgi:hypothetical protein